MMFLSHTESRGHGVTQRAGLSVKASSLLTLTIPEDHIFTGSGGTPSLWPLKLAQSSGKMLVHHTADVPLEVGEKDALGIPLGLHWFLPAFDHPDTSLLCFFHGDWKITQEITVNQMKNVTGPILLSGSAEVRVNGILFFLLQIDTCKFQKDIFIWIHNVL